MRKFELEAVSMGISPGGYPGAFTIPVKRLIQDTISGKVLHLYSGSSFIGDERIDIEHPNATQNIDVYDFVKTDDRQWDFVILDPPYQLKQQEQKQKGYGKKLSMIQDVKVRRAIRAYFHLHVDNILWLDYCAPIMQGFGRKKLWLLIPLSFERVRILSWLKRENGALL